MDTTVNGNKFNIVAGRSLSVHRVGLCTASFGRQVRGFDHYNARICVQNNDKCILYSISQIV